MLYICIYVKQKHYSTQRLQLQFQLVMANQLQLDQSLPERHTAASESPAPRLQWKARASSHIHMRVSPNTL